MIYKASYLRKMQSAGILLKTVRHLTRCYCLLKVSQRVLSTTCSQHLVGQHDTLLHRDIYNNDSRKYASKSRLQTAADVKRTSTSADKAADLNQMAADLCNEIHQKFQSKASSVILVPKEMQHQIIVQLLSSKVSAESIVQTLSQHQLLLTFSTTVWEETISLLRSYSFEPPQILPLIASTPSLLKATSRPVLNDVLTLLRSFGISEHKRQQILLKNPKLLCCGGTKPIVQRYKNLQDFFTKSEVQSLMFSNPNVLTDPWEETEEKIKYVYVTMGIRSREMLRSRFFQHSVLHIMTRHQFAVRAGFYRTPTKHEIAAVEANQPAISDTGNLSLKEIVDSTDRAFARSIGGLTLAEYNAFADMMALEYNNSATDTETDAADSDNSDDEEDSD